jgi:uncharacterized protein YdhG (YjbR/CyaY superfamily)
MKRSVNVTLRIDAELKALAERAAEVKDVSLSQVVRRAFRELIRKASYDDPDFRRHVSMASEVWIRGRGEE